MSPTFHLWVSKKKRGVWRVHKSDVQNRWDDNRHTWKVVRRVKPERQHPLLNYLKDFWPCAGGLSAVNVIGTRLRDSTSLGLTRWRLKVYTKYYVDAVAETGRNPVSKHQIQPEYGLTVGGRSNLSRETKLSGANEDREKFIFPVLLTTSGIGDLTRSIHSLL